MNLMAMRKSLVLLFIFSFVWADSPSVLNNLITQLFNVQVSNGEVTQLPTEGLNREGRNDLLIYPAESDLPRLSRSVSGGGGMC